METRLTPFQRFNRLLKVDKKDISQVYIYAFFNGIVNLSLPIGVQAIVNLIQGGEISTSWIILVGFVIVGVALTGILQLLQLRIVENIAQKIFSRASFEFAYRIPKIKHSALHDYYAPELANRFFDTITIQKGLPKILIEFSLALFQIIVGLFVLSLYHSFFILFSIILIALIYFIIATTGPIGLKTSIKESKFKYKIAFWLEEIARTKLSFKLVSQSDMNLTKSNYHVNNYLNSRESHFNILINQSLYLIAFKVLIAAGLLITGSILVFNGEMNIGQFVAAEIIIILIIASVEKLIKSLDSIYDVLTALEKIGYVTDMPLDRDEGLLLDENTDAFSVAVDNLSYKYPGSATKTLDTVSFEIPKETSVYITGPANSGKSTLLQLMSGILDPNNGIIRYKGFPMKSLNFDSLRKHIGFALSNNDIFEGSILDNITMLRENATAERISKALKITGLINYISTVPLGLKTIIDPEGSKIPRNIQNRIILARAIVTEPKLLILEDPLDHVKRKEKRAIIEALVAKDNNWSIIVTSVDEVWKEYIDNQIVMSNGRVIENNIKL